MFTPSLHIFTHLYVALKEANETDYWVELLYQSKIIDKTGFESINLDITELLKLLTSIIKSSKTKVDIK
ncbi:MAG: four helix bundle protein [Thermodesulfobacteriota bacterium]|nr:four helix bundle protein [Thermodesulfobacteriota bacterium]